MNADPLRKHCQSRPGVTEDIKWGADLVFSVAGKMFCVLDMAPAEGHGRGRMSFKVEADRFLEFRPPRHRSRALHGPCAVDIADRSPSAFDRADENADPSKLRTGVRDTVEIETARVGWRLSGLDSDRVNPLRLSSACASARSSTPRRGRSRPRRCRSRRRSPSAATSRNRL
jgi:YjbR